MKFSKTTNNQYILAKLYQILIECFIFSAKESKLELKDSTKMYQIMLVTPPIFPFQSYIEHCYLDQINLAQKQFFQFLLAKGLQKCLVTINEVTTYSMVPNNSAARLLIFEIFSLPTRLIWTYTLIKIQIIFLPTCLLSIILNFVLSNFNAFYSLFSLQLLQ